MRERDIESSSVDAEREAEHGTNKKSVDLWSVARRRLSHRR